MKSFKQYLKEGYESDKAVRTKALKFWDKFYKHVINSDVSDFREVPKYGGWVIPASDIDSSLKKLYIVIGHGEKSGYGHIESGGDIIVLTPLLKPFSDKYLDTRLKGTMEKFVHEFTHYLDNYRRKGSRGVGSAPKYDAGDASAYINNPEEFNAYYQEGVTAIEDWFYNDNVSPKAKLTLWDDNFEKWYRDYGTSFFMFDFIRLLNPKYTKKLKKRLYTVHQQIKKDSY